jgi:hypothetical protein
MRKEIKSIAPVRLGVIFAAMFALASLVFGVLGLIFGSMMGPEVMGEAAGMGGFGMSAGGGIIGIVLGFFISLVVGFILGVVEAFIYNFIAGIVGGVVLTLEDA